MNSESINNTEIYESVAYPPAGALKTIGAGRLKGMTDINPQWRYLAMTRVFGPIGIGWAYKEVDRWERTVGEEIAVFVKIAMRVKYKGEWSEPIEGIGGSRLASAETRGLHFSDEAYKMATTDALSVAMKQLGVAAAIYSGFWDGSKYTVEISTPEQDAKLAQIDADNKRLQELKKPLVSEKKKAFLETVAKLKLSPSVLIARLGEIGFESCNDVPESHMRDVYNHLKEFGVNNG